MSACLRYYISSLSNKTCLVIFQGVMNINPFTLRAAKTGLAILKIFFLQKHFEKLKEKC